MTAVLAAVATDPFKEVLAQMNDIAAKVGKITGPVTDLDTALGKVTGVIEDIDELFTALDDVCTAINDTRLVCLGLTAIPVVGEVAGEAAGILSDVSTVAQDLKKFFDPVKQDIDKVDKVLTKVQNGLDKLRAVTVAISTDVPNFTNTVMILDCLMEIAQPLAEALKGNDAADRLDALITEYNKIKEEVAGDIEPVIKAIDAIATVVSDFVVMLDDAVKSVADKLSGALSSLNSIDSVLGPIGHAMQKVEDAIAPVKWALDAASCIFNKVFKPVIDEVMKVTGLQSLVDKLEDELKHYLGIDAVINAISKAFHLDKITQYGALFDTTNSDSATSQSVSGWSTLSTTLGSYSQNNNAGTKKAIAGLASAVIGNEIDPNKPTPIPDWPNPPQYNLPDSTTAAATLNTAMLTLMGPSTQSAMAEPMVMMAMRASAPTSDWPQQQALKASISQLVTRLTALTTDSQTMATNLQAFTQSLQIPDTFSTQLSDLHDLFKTSDDFFKFASKWQVLAPILSPVEAVLAQQLADAATVSQSMPELASAVKNIDSAVQNVINHTPSDTVINKAIKALNGWSDGADSLVNLVNSGQQSGLTPDQQQGLKAQQAAAEVSCQTVQGRVTEMATLATAIDGSISGINQALTTYAQTMQSVTDYDQLISDKALPTVTKVAVKLKTIDSIFDPLSELLELTGTCTDSSNILKKGASVSMGLLKSGAVTTGQSVANEVAEALESVAEKVLPLGKLNTAVTSATTTLSDQVLNELNTHCAALVDQLNQLTDKLSNAYTCDYTDKDGKAATTPNQFVSTDQVKSAMQLIQTYN